MDDIARGEMARYRAGIYGTASRLFLDAPSAPELRQLALSGRSIAPEDCVRASEFGLMRYMGLLEGEDIEALRTRVATEYAELFVGPRPPLAPVYESIYVGMNRHLMNETTECVRTCYESFGLGVRKRNRIPDDHLGYELEFLGLLCEREAEAWAGGEVSGARELQRAEAQFIDEHPLRWIDQLVQRIEEAPCGDFYAASARFTAAFLREDGAYLLDAASEGIDS